MGIEQIRQIKMAAKQKPKEQLRGIIKTEDLARSLSPNVMTGGQFAHVQRGNYETSKGLTYFRSKWEANFSLFLDFRKKRGEIKDWEFEPEAFMFDKIKSGTRKYIPDFKVFNTDGTHEFFEVKGHQVAKDLTKQRRMAKYYPEIKITVIDKSFYSDMIKKLKGVIKFY